MTPSRLLFSLLMFCSTFSMLCLTDQWVSCIGSREIGRIYRGNFIDEEGALFLKVRCIL